MRLLSALYALPGAIYGLGKAYLDISQKKEDSSLISTISDLFNKRIPDPFKVGRAIFEAKKIITNIQAEGKSVLRKFHTFTPSIEEATHILKNSPSFEAYVQALTQKAVYAPFPEGTYLPSSELFPTPRYAVEKVLEYTTGLKMMFLAPLEKGAPPLVIVRGTNPKNIDNIVDDLNAPIGNLNFSQHKEEIERTLKEFRSRYGRIQIAGHSFGGAFAQLLTATYPALFSSCTTHNGVGTSDEIVQRFQNNCRSLPRELSKPLIQHYRHVGDVVSLIGKQLPTSPENNITFGNKNDPISSVDAHSYNTLSFPGMARHFGPVASSSLAATAQFIDTIRADLSYVVPFYEAMTT